MDKLTLEIINSIPPEQENGPQQVYAQILINDKLIISGFEYPVDIIDLIKSTKSTGNYYFWTCHCGIPACAFISVHVEVKHENSLVKWKLMDLPFIQDTTFIFDKSAYQSTVELAWRNFKQSIQSNIDQKIDFDIYPSPGLTGINKLLEEES